MTSLYLLGIDIQQDFCPGGSLAVPNGDEVVAPWNQITHALRKTAAATIFSRDYHPARTNHFTSFGGEWPVHCVAGSEGAMFHPDLQVEATDTIIDKGVGENDPGYSAFAPLLKRLVIPTGATFIVGGLATDYCVKATVNDLLREKFNVILVVDAIRAVEQSKGGSGERSLTEMKENGAVFLTTHDVLVRAQSGDLPAQRPQ